MTLVEHATEPARTHAWRRQRRGLSPLRPLRWHAPRALSESNPTQGRWLAATALGLVAAAWTALRLTMNVEYASATLTTLVELQAPAPFGQRVLVPLLCRPFVHAGVPVATAFAAAEWLATIVLVLAMRRALARDLPSRAASLGSLGVLGVLAFPMLLAHRWNVFYPWDTWAMAVLVLAVDAIRRERMALALALVFVGTFNRESTVLLPLVAIVLHLERPTLRHTAAWSVWFVLAYLSARGLAQMIVPPRGESLHLWVGGELRLLSNLRWLTTRHDALLWLGSIGCAPIALWAVRRHAPRDLVRLHVPLLVGLTGLLVVANAYEPRVYGELIVVAYLPVFVGAWRWATDSPVEGRADRWVAFVDRWFAITWALAAMIAALLVMPRA